MTPVLVTGVGSGLGRFLHERFGGSGLTRQTSASEWELLRRHGADIIIHCAANSRRGVDRDALASYLDDNLFLTERLVLFPHRRFIYLSSVDVYPKVPGPHRESAPILADQVSGVYATTKLMSEAIVAAHACAPLILRSSALLGAYSRRNSLIRMIEDDPCALGLSGDSSLNYVLHEDIAGFIALALERGIEGTYNATSSENITLEQIASLLGKKVAFGSHRYDAGTVDNSRIAAACPAFARTSVETVGQFLRARQAEPR